MRKILPISPKPNFTPNTLGCYGLRTMLTSWCVRLPPKTCSGQSRCWPPIRHLSSPHISRLFWALVTQLWGKMLARRARDRFVVGGEAGGRIGPPLADSAAAGPIRPPEWTVNASRADKHFLFIICAWLRKTRARPRPQSICRIHYGCSRAKLWGQPFRHALYILNLSRVKIP